MRAEPSPRLESRIAGLLYLAVIAGGAFAEASVRGRLIVPGDAARTAASILTHEFLYRLGLVADLLPLLCNVGLAVIFYRLFEVVGRRAAALVVLFSLIGNAIQACALLFHLAPLLILEGGPAAGGLTQGQLQGLAYLSLRLQAEGYTIALLFFGGSGICIGWLILLPCLAGELSLALWLTLKGIDAGRWTAQAAARDANLPGANPPAASIAAAF